MISESGGVLQRTIHKNPPLKQQEQMLVAVEATPSLLRHLSQLEHHRQTSLPRAAALGSAMPESDRREG